jgi:hypothetical protein
MIESIVDKVNRVAKEFADAYATWTTIQHDLDRLDAERARLVDSLKAARYRWEVAQKELKEIS